jgi:hypothetical protein
MNPYEPTERDLSEMNREFLLMEVEGQFGRRAVDLLINLSTKKEEN